MAAPSGVGRDGQESQGHLQWSAACPVHGRGEGLRFRSDSWTVAAWKTGDQEAREEE